jgi:ribonucleoside-diphosphate reductase beta chain
MSRYRELYYRWEREQWEAGAIDLSSDRPRWERLGDEEREAVIRPLSALYAAGHRTLTNLVPFVDAVVTEEQQVFLTTQLADIGRHVVLLDRFVGEVWQEDAAEVMARAKDLSPALAALLHELIPEVADRLAEVPATPVLVDGIRLHHVELERELASLLDELAAAARSLPGLAEGVSSMQRDHRRHAEFGRAFLAEYAGGDPG